MKQVIVTGGRDYNDFAMVEDVLSFINPDLVIHGGCSGADSLAKNWAKYNLVNEVTFLADWDKYGKSAGPKRNVKMIVEHPNAIVVAFPGGKGTENCIQEAIKRNRIVLIVK